MIQIKLKGFSLLELMAVIAIVAILLAIAIPSYQTYVTKSRRVDAIHTLTAIQLAQEQYRTQNSTYGTITQVWNGVTTTPDGYYNLAISNISATSYTITATAIGNQTNDSEGSTSCSTMTLTYSSGSTSKTPTPCWLDN